MLLIYLNLLKFIKTILSVLFLIYRSKSVPNLQKWPKLKWQFISGLKVSLVIPFEYAKILGKTFELVLVDNFESNNIYDYVVQTFTYTKKRGNFYVCSIFSVHFSSISNSSMYQKKSRGTYEWFSRIQLVHAYFKYKQREQRWAFSNTLKQNEKKTVKTILVF